MTDPNGTQGAAYSQAITATGGTGGLTLSLNGGGLPLGLSLTNGTIVSGTSGITGGPGNYNFSIRAVDTLGVSYTKNMSINVIGSPSTALPRINVGNFDDATVGNGFSIQVGICCGGTAPFTWQVAANTLPVGLSLRSGSGVTSNYVSPGNVEVFGFPRSAGQFSPVFTLTDANGASTSLTIPINVSVLDQTPGLTNGTIGVAYSSSLRLLGGTPPYSAVQPATSLLPAGLTLNGANPGVSGTPGETGFFNPQLQFTDSASSGLKRTENFSISGGTASGSISINTQSNLGIASSGSAYNLSFNAFGATTINWTLTGGSLPTGTTLTTAGVLSSGSNTLTTGIYTFTLTASDALGVANPAVRQFTLQVSPLNITTSPSLTFGNLTVAYGPVTLAASGGVGTLTWTVDPYNFLPPGLSLSTSGLLSGTPTSTGQYGFNISVVDSATPNNKSSRFFTLSIFPAGGGPVPVINGITNGGDQSLPPLAPGSQASLYGTLLSPSTVSSTAAPLPTTMAGVSVTVNGVASPLFFVSPGQFNFQIPYGTPTGVSVPVIVTNNGHSSNTFQLAMVPAAPGIGPNPIQNAVGNITNSAANPAAPGSTVVVYLTGLGAVTPAVATGTAAPSSPLSLPVAAASATVNGIAATITFIGLAPNLVGLGQANITIPAGLANGSYPLAITVNGKTSASATVFVTTPVLLISNGSTTAGNLGTYPLGVNEIGLVATGGTGTYAWSVASGSSLPAGFALRTDVASYLGTTPQAEIAMLPQAPGTYTFTLNVTSGTQTASRAFSVRITALEIQDTFLPDAFAGTTYTYQFTPVGNNGPVTYSTVTGNLPAGVTLSSTGLLTSAITTPGNYNVNFSIADSADSTFAYGYTLNVYGINITTPPDLGNVSQNASFSQQITATGGTAPYTFSLGGSLPSGLSLSSTGLISGNNVTASPGVFSFNVTAVDSSASHVSYTRTMSITVVGVPVALPRISIGEVDDAILGQKYNWGFNVFNGGTGPFTWTATGLPAGMSIRTGTALQGLTNPTAGQIYGVPQQAGPFNVTLTVKDANNVPVSLTFPFNVSVMDVRSQQSNSESMNNGVINTPYNSPFFQLRMIGGTPPYSIQKLAAGALPSGVSANFSTLAVSGTPVENGSFGPVFQFADSAGNSFTHNTSLFISDGTAPFTISINNNGGFNGYDLGTTSTGVAYSTSFSAGGATSYYWTIAGGTAPPGLSFPANSGTVLAANGVFSGTPTTPGVYTFLVKADGTGGSTGFKQFRLTVTPIVASGSNTLPFGNVGTAYNQTLAVTGNSGALAWSLYPYNFMPAGLSLSTAGVITGTPTSVGFSSFNVVVTDASNNSFIRNYSISVYAAGAFPPVNINIGTTLGPNVLGILTTQLIGSGGTGTGYVYTYSPGATPIPGMRIQSGQPLPTSFTSTGGLIGVVAPGTYTSSIRVTDSANNSLFFDRAFTMVVSPLALLDQGTLPKGIVGTAYNGTGYQLNPTGGTGAYTFTTTNAPPGMTLSSTGLFSGTPTSAGTFNVSVTVGNAAVTCPAAFSSCKVTFTETIVVNAFAITNGSTLPQATVNVPYSNPFVAPGCTSCAWSESGTLPTGFSFNNATGTLAGTFTNSNGFLGSFTVTATGSNGTVSKIFDLVIPATAIQGLQVTTAITTTNVLGSLQALTLNAAGGQPPYTYTVSTGTLPSGITLQGTGDTLGSNLAPGFYYLAGRAMQAGTSNFTIQVTDSASHTATKAFAWVISPMTISYSSLPIANTTMSIGTPYTQPILVLGGTGTYTSWTLPTPPIGLPAGSPYPGLTLNSGTGVLSGTPTDTESISTLWTVNDSGSGTVTQSVSIGAGISQTSVILGGPALGTVVGAGSNNTYNLSPSGGTAPYTITAIGNLPAGVLLFSPTSNSLTTSFAANSYSMQVNFALPGTYTFTLQIKDANNLTGARTYSFVVPASNSLLSQVLPDASVGVAYSAALVAPGATSFALAPGALYPPGLTVSAGGVLSGTPTAAGFYLFNLVFGDPANLFNVTFTMNVSKLAVTNSTVLPTAFLGKLYNGLSAGYSLTATGGTPPLSWSISQNALPSGMSFSTAGAFTGTPAFAGTGRYSFTVTVTDSTNATVNVPMSLYLEQTNPGLVTYNIFNTTLTDAVLGQNFSVAINPDGGAPPYTISVAAGSSLPQGLALLSGSGLPVGQSPGGTVLAGAPTIAGQFTFSLNIKDSKNAQTTRTFTLNVTPLNVAAGNPPNATLNVPYQFQFVASGGTAPYTYALLQANNPLFDLLPSGLSMSSSGLISGTPTSTGPFSIKLKVTDAAGLTLTKILTLTITNAQGLSITSSNFATIVGAAITANLTTNGSSTYTWTTPNGGLPPGLTLSSGVISGYATTPGVYQVKLRATDTNNSASVADRILTYTVSPMQLVSHAGVITPGFIPPATVSQPYSYTFKVANGLPPYTYTESPFSPLPPGMTLSTTGVLTGSPSQTGDFFIRLIVTDSTGARLIGTGNASAVTLTVLPAGVPQPLNPRANVSGNASLNDASVGSPYVAPLDRYVSGGAPPFTWTVAAGPSLPAGLAIYAGSNGVSNYVGGIPTTPITNNVVNFLVTDSASQTVTVPLTLNVSVLGLSPTVLPTSHSGSAYSATLTPSGGTPPYTLSSSGTSILLPGIAGNAAGVLTGTALDAGLFLQNVTVTDNAGNTLNRTFEIVSDNAAGEVPGISLSPRPLNMLYIQGNAAASGALQVQSTSGNLGFNSALLGLTGGSLSATSGTTAANPSVNISTSVAPGRYFGIAAAASTQAVYGNDAIPVLLTVLAPPPCAYTINPASATVPASGGSGSFSMTAGPTCAWTAAPDQSSSWLHITNTPPAAGNGSVNFSADLYTGTAQRTGTIVAGGQTFTVAQFGASCAFSLDPLTLNVPSSGGSASINVHASASSCAWPASSGLSVSTPTTPTGSGQATITIPLNTNASGQTLTATIAGQTVTVLQGGAACNVTLGSTNAGFDANGGQGSVTVNAAPGCTYTSTPGAGWISLDSGTSGTLGASGQATLAFTATPNSTTSTRNGSFSIGGQIFQVLEDGRACTIGVDTSQLPNPFPVTGGPGIIGLTANGPNCQWTASSASAFASVSPPGSNGSGQLTVTLASNASSSSARSGSVVISGQTIGFTQAGTVCTYGLRSNSSGSPAVGGLGTVSVVAASACAWTATSNSSFLTVNTGASSSGTSEVQFIVAPNITASSRTGTLTVAGNTFTVSQAAASCSFTLGTASATLPLANTGITGATIPVTATVAGCSLTAVSYANWLTVNTTFAGTSGTVTYNALANNSGSLRSGNIQIGDKVYAVTETGATCSYTLNSSGASYNLLGGTGIINALATPGSCPAPSAGVTVPAVVTLGAETGPSTTNVFTQNYTVNPFSSLVKATRRAVITLGGQIFSIKQNSY